MTTFYDMCSEIWSGCPATTGVENRLDTGESVEHTGVDPGMSDANHESVATGSPWERSINVPSVESSDGQSNERPSSPYCAFNGDNIAQENGDDTDSEVLTNRKKIIEHIIGKQDMLAETLKEEILSEIQKQMDIKEYLNSMSKFATVVENLSDSVSNAVGIIGTLLNQPGRNYREPQFQCLPQQEPLHGHRVEQARGSDDLHYVNDNAYEYRSL